MTEDMIENLGDIAAGKIAGRKNDEEKILFGMGGMRFMMWPGAIPYIIRQRKWDLARH